MKTFFLVLIILLWGINSFKMRNNMANGTIGQDITSTEDYIFNTWLNISDAYENYVKQINPEFVDIIQNYKRLYRLAEKTTYLNNLLIEKSFTYLLSHLSFFLPLLFEGNLLDLLMFSSEVQNICRYAKFKIIRLYSLNCLQLDLKVT